MRASSGSGGSGKTTIGSIIGLTERPQVAVVLERRDLRLVRPPLRPLVAEEPLEDVLAEGVEHELGALHHPQGVRERLRELLDAELGQLLVGQLEQVGLGLRRQVVLLLDALQPGGQDQREREVGVAGGIGRAVLEAGGVRAAPLGDGHPDEAGAVVAGPRDVDRRLEPRHEPLVGVDGLVGDGGDLGGVVEQAGHEPLGHRRQVVGVVRRRRRRSPRRGRARRGCACPSPARPPAAWA